MRKEVSSEQKKRSKKCIDSMKGCEEHFKID